MSSSFMILSHKTLLIMFFTLLMKSYIRIILFSIAIIFLLVIGAFVYLQTPSGQALVTTEVTKFLETKFGSKVSAKRIAYHIPDWIELDEVFVADNKKDTLVAAQKLYVDLDMLALLKSKVTINKVELEGIRAKIKRTLPDTTFNFDHIVKAFASPNATPTKNDTTPSSLLMNIGKVSLKDIHVTYLDNVIGTDADVAFKSFETSFKKIDLNSSTYQLANTKLNGANLLLKTYPALKVSPPDTNSSLVNFGFEKVNLDDIAFDISDQVGGLSTKGHITKASAEADKFSMAEQLIHLKTFYLDNSSVKVNIKPTPKSSQKPVPAPTVAQSKTPEKGWTFGVQKILMKSNTIAYDDLGKPRQSKGLDPAHIGITPLNIEAERIQYSPKGVTGWLQNISMKEKSGFVLQKFQTDFAYTDKKAFLKKLTIQTPKSIIRDEVSLSYNSLDQLSKNIGVTRVLVNLKDSKLAFSDILLLAPQLAQTPPLAGNSQEVLRFKGKATGTVNNLSIAGLTIQGFDHSKIQLHGNIVGLPSVEKTSVKVGIDEVSVTKSDIQKIVPKEMLPTAIELPETIVLKGTIGGKVNNLNVNTQLISDLGKAQFKGTLVNITVPNKQQYDGQLSLNEFDLGKLLKQPEQYGKMTLVTDFHGKGTNPKTMDAEIKGKIEQAVIKGYDYKDLQFSTTIRNQEAQINALFEDPNANFNLQAKANLANEYPAIQGTLAIKQLKLKNLHLYPDDIAIKGQVKMNLTNTNPAKFNGSIAIDEAVVTQDGKPIPLDDIKILAQNNNERNAFSIQAPFLQAQMFGQFNYVQLADIIISDINRHFRIPNQNPKLITEPYDITIKAKAIGHPAIKAFVPALTRLDSTTFNATLSNEAGHTMQMDLKIPFVEYDTIRVQQIAFGMRSDSSKITYQTSLEKLSFNAFQMLKTKLDGEVNDNIAQFNLVLLDSLQKEHHRVAGQVANFSDQFRINLLPNGLKLNYEPWKVAENGFLQYGEAGLIVSNFSLQNQEQLLQIHTPEMAPNAPLEIIAQKLDLHKMIKLVYPDSTIADGTIDGKIILANYMKSPSFTGDVTVQGFTFQNTPIGDLVAHVYNETPEKISVNTTLKNDQNDIALIGNYILGDKKPLNFSLNINKLSTKTIQAFSFGQMRRANGSLNGNITIKGANEQPDIAGFIGFEKVAFDVSQLGTKLLIDKQKIYFQNHEMEFKNFTLSDTLNQPLRVNGKVIFQKLPEVEYKLAISTKNFMVLNSTRKDNDFFYGKAFVDANMNISGSTSTAVVDGNVKLIEKSSIFVLMPDNSVSEEAINDVVVFVDKNKKALTKDSTNNTQTKYNTSFISEVSLLLEADEKSEMTIVVDELNGDNLKVRGKAQLNAGISSNGQPYILGMYSLTEGSYDLSFELLKKQFKIKPGSNIVWMGDPLSGNIDITAIYQTMASPSDLLSSTESQYRQKMPFDVNLNLNGPMKKLETSFSITLNDKTQLAIDNDVKTKINDRLKYLAQTDIAENNKQVFALLILNRFFSEKSSDFFSTINPEAIARQSVSKLLSDQLERLAADVIKGVNLSVNLNSSQSNIAGQSSARTDLNLGLSKAFFNDRLKVEVGKNFELENTNGVQRNPTEVFDNVAVNYSLTEDGRYRFRAFRKNQFQTVLEGFVVETGVSFVITLEYQSVKEFFQKNNK